MNLLNRIFGIKEKSPEITERLLVKDVQPGQFITIEWKLITNGIGVLKCINNDPVTRKILLEVEWSNYEEIKCSQTQQIILDYDSVELKNFHLLNQPVPRSEDFDKKYFEKRKNEAVEKQEFELAGALQTVINELNKK